MNTEFTNEITLEEIFNYIDKDACVQAHIIHVNAAGNVVQRLTAKKLEEGEVPLVAEVSKGKNESGVRVCFYANGFGLYYAADRKTILDVAQCLEYVYHFGLKIDWLPGEQKIGLDELLTMKWYQALAIFGETRIENKIMNDAASRLGKNAKEYTNSDDGDFMGFIENIADKHAVDPVKAIIYKECIEESLNALNYKQKTVFKSAVIEERTDLEVSNMLGIDRTAVTKRKNRALRNIRNSHIWD